MICTKESAAESAVNTTLIQNSRFSLFICFVPRERYRFENTSVN